MVVPASEWPSNSCSVRMSVPDCRRWVAKEWHLCRLRHRHHCYAPHLLEAGVDLDSLSQWLGHSHVSTTTRYLHLVRPDVPDGARRTPLALLSALESTPPQPAA